MTVEESNKGSSQMKCGLFLGPVIGSAIGVGFAFMIHYVGNETLYNYQILAAAGLTQY